MDENNRNRQTHKKNFEDFQFENTGVYTSERIKRANTNTNAYSDRKSYANSENITRRSEYSNTRGVPRSQSARVNRSNAQFQRENGRRNTSNRNSVNNKQGFPKGLMLLILLVLLLLIVFLSVFVFGGEDSQSNKNNTSQGSNTQIQKEPVWYEQSEIPDVHEIEYTPPIGVEFPYYIKVNRAMCCVTVYGIDSNGEYTIPIKAFACSVGREGEETILGEYQMSQNLGAWWCKMVDDTYGQFAYRIYEGYMFHSVPTYEMERDSLETEEFNKLGSPASLGCIRLNVRDAKWICDNCPVGTTTLIYDDTTTPGPLGKPDTIKLPIGHEWSGWDPTDPHKDNPWHNASAVIEASDINVKVGESIDILKNVKAYDTCGNDITEKMTWYGKYSFDVAGTYSVTFKVIDAIGSKAVKSITITVSDGKSNNNESEKVIKATVPASLSNEITSEYAVLVNLKNGETMLDKKANEKMYPASITKAFALLIILENIEDMNESFVIKQETFEAVREEDASVANFPLEVPIKAIDLIHGSFMLSGAEATVTLAENIAGSESAFVEIMNNRAKELGMNNTNFTNATGLHNENQYSTCADIALFMKTALKNEQFKQIFTTKEYTTQCFDEYPTGMTFSSTMFKFIGTNTPKNGFKILGGKTGYTSNAGLCLASYAKSDKVDNEFILVTCKAPGNYWDVELPNHALDALTIYGAIIEA